MLRHLLLALFLIGLSLPAMALPARGQSAPVDCHGTQPTHKPDGNAGKVGHFCIGCVANPALPGLAELGVIAPITVEAILPTYLYRFRKGGQFADQVIPAV